MYIKKKIQVFLQVNIAFRHSHMNQKCTTIKVLTHTLKNGRDFSCIELYAY